LFNWPCTFTAAKFKRPRVFAKRGNFYTAALSSTHYFRYLAFPSRRPPRRLALFNAGSATDTLTNCSGKCLLPLIVRACLDNSAAIRPLQCAQILAAMSSSKSRSTSVEIVPPTGPRPIDLAGVINGALANNSKDIDRDDDVDEDAEPERQAPSAPPKTSASVSAFTQAPSALLHSIFICSRLRETLPRHASVVCALVGCARV